MFFWIFSEYIASYGDLTSKYHWFMVLCLLALHFMLLGFIRTDAWQDLLCEPPLVSGH